jgi:hypothetical protein
MMTCYLIFALLMLGYVIFGIVRYTPRTCKHDFYLYCFEPFLPFPPLDHPVSNALHISRLQLRTERYCSLDSLVPLGPK